MLYPYLTNFRWPAEVFSPTFVEALVQIYTDSPFAFGGADICCIDAQHMIQIAALFTSSWEWSALLPIR